MQHDVSEREIAVNGLRDAEERYRRLTENLPGVVTYVAEYENSRLRLSYVSPQVEGIFGYPRDSWLGDRPVWVEALHTDDRERVLERERRRFEECEEFDLEYRLICEDGSVVWVWDRDTITSSPARVRSPSRGPARRHHREEGNRGRAPAGRGAPPLRRPRAGGGRDRDARQR